MYQTPNGGQSFTVYSAHCPSRDEAVVRLRALLVEAGVPLLIYDANRNGADARVLAQMQSLSDAGYEILEIVAAEASGSA